MNFNTKVFRGNGDRDILTWQRWQRLGLSAGRATVCTHAWTAFPSEVKVTFTLPIDHHAHPVLCGPIILPTVPPLSLPPPPQSLGLTPALFPQPPLPLTPPSIFSWDLIFVPLHLHNFRAVVTLDSSSIAFTSGTSSHHCMIKDWRLKQRLPIPMKCSTSQLRKQ